ncbi:hypothetical protein BT93_B1650 [Corymbia citriodora subsp. variegata]|nr:hypothetical protein BT93_B1650 [Corymbia citriodora subsp. variegata]
MTRGKTNLLKSRSEQHKFPTKFQPRKRIGCRDHSMQYKDVIAKRFTNFKKNISTPSQKI